MSGVSGTRRHEPRRQRTVHRGGRSSGPWTPRRTGFRTWTGCDHKGFGGWLVERPLDWRLGVQVVAIGPSAAFRKALRFWLPRTAVSVYAFIILPGSNMLTEVRRRLPQEIRGRRGHPADPDRASSLLQLRACGTHSARGSDRLGSERLGQVFDLDNPSGKLQTAWSVTEQLRALLRTGSLEDVSAAKVETNNTAVRHLKRTRRGPAHSRSYTTRIIAQKRRQNSGLGHPPHGAPRTPRAQFGSDPCSSKDSAVSTVSRETMRHSD